MAYFLAYNFKNVTMNKESGVSVPHHIFKIFISTSSEDAILF